MLLAVFYDSRPTGSITRFDLLANVNKLRQEWPFFALT